MDLPAGYGSNLPRIISRSNRNDLAPRREERQTKNREMRKIRRQRLLPRRFEPGLLDESAHVLK
jgi:hypothetical protein